jgi:hypothetical protein
MPFDGLDRFITQIGFPIFVAVVLLMRVDKMHAENITAINNLVTTLRELHKCIEHRFSQRLRPQSAAKRARR